MRIQTMLLVFVLVQSNNLFAGGPWLAKKGTGFLQAQVVIPAYQYSGLLMSHFRDVQRINRYTYNADFMIYGEYGITDKIDLITTIPFKYVKTGNRTEQLYHSQLLDEGSLTGLSNYHLGIKHVLIDASLKMAISIHSRFNTGLLDMDKGLAKGFNSSSYGIMLHAGRGKSKRYGFAEVGYYYMSNGFSGIIEMNLEQGWNFRNNWNVALAFNMRKSLRNGDFENGNLVQTGLYLNNQEWIVGGVKVAKVLKNGWGLNAAVPLIPIYFKYVGFNGTFTFGVFKKI